MQEIRDEMSISHQEETGSKNVLLRGLPIINLKLLAAEGHIKVAENSFEEPMPNSP